MRTSATKKEILERGGYTYDFRRMVYYNRRTMKVFSIEAIQDNDEHWLQKCIEEENGIAGWRFYFTSAPSEAVKRELVSELAGW
jgi:hypothetical protein